MLKAKLTVMNKNFISYLAEQIKPRTSIKSSKLKIGFKFTKPEAFQLK